MLQTERVRPWHRWVLVMLEEIMGLSLSCHACLSLGKRDSTQNVAPVNLGYLVENA